MRGVAFAPFCLTGFIHLTQFADMNIRPPHCGAGAAIFFSAMPIPLPGEPIPGQWFADIQFSAEAEPQTDPAGGHIVILSWLNPGRNTWRVEASDDLETWSGALEGYSFSDDVSSVPVYIAAPVHGLPPPKPLRTVSLRQTTAGWFASWVDVVDNDPLRCVQPLTADPPEFDGYICSAEAASHRFVFTQFRVSDPSRLAPPPWTEIPPLTSLPPLAQTTFAEIGATLAAYQGSYEQPPPPIPPPDSNAARIFYRVQILTDSDDDGLSDAEELNTNDGPDGQPLHSPPLGTDPFDQDTDHDGIPDGDEIAGGSDPLDPNSKPPITGDQLVIDIRRREFDYGFWPSFPGTNDQLSFMTLQAPDTSPPFFFDTAQPKPSLSALTGGGHEVCPRGGAI